MLPPAGGCHCKVTVVPVMLAMRPVGAPGGDCALTAIARPMVHSVSSVPANQFAREIIM